jgi:hypothetical protein
MLMYLLTAIGLTPGGSSTAHIYTTTIRTPKQLKILVGNRNQSGQTKINDELSILYAFFIVVPCFSMELNFIHQPMHFLLTFWRRNYFFLILAHSVYKM